MKLADGELRHILLYDLKTDPAQVREVMADARQTKASLLSVTLKSKLADETAIAKAYAKRLEIPFVALGKQDIPKKTLTRIPWQLVEKYQVVCFDETSTSIKLAMHDPHDEQARKAIKTYVGKTVRRYLATTSELISTMRQIRKLDDHPHPLTTRELLHTILSQVAKTTSRDIRFETKGEHTLVQRRHGKQLVTVATIPAARGRALLTWCKTQTSFRVKLDGESWDILVSTLPLVGGEQLNLKLIPSSQHLPSFHQLGAGAPLTSAITSWLKNGRGLTIVAGGRNTDLPALSAQILSQATHHLSSVTSTEDPLHVRLPNVQQLEVSDELSRDEALSRAIDSSANLIAIPGFTSRQSTELLVDYVLSNHAALVSMYATSAQHVFDHLQKLPVVPALLAASLRLVVVQHRVAKLCTTCRMQFDPKGPLKKALWAEFNFLSDVALYRQGTGCNKCIDGVADWLYVCEKIPVTPELQQLLASGADARNRNAMIAQLSDYRTTLAHLAARGTISIDEATRAV